MQSSSPYAPPGAPLAPVPEATEDGRVEGAINRIDLDEIAHSYDRAQIAIRMLRGIACASGGAGLLFLGFGFVVPWLFIAAIFPLAIGAGFEYGRRRLAAGSSRAAWVLSSLFGLLLLGNALSLFVLGDDDVGAGARALTIASAALGAVLCALLLAGCTEPLRQRARAWRQWTANHGGNTQQEQWFSFLGLPVVPPGKGRRLALGLATWAIVAEAFGFTSYLGISDRMASVAERNPGIAFGVAFAGIVFATVVGILFARLAFAIARRLRNRARRHLIRSAEEAMATDLRPPVLFLRSFADDQVSLQNAETGLLSLLDPGVSAGTLDELIIRCWAARAPVIAIGSPDEKSAPVGAARHYVSGESWQETVQRLADKSKAIVVGISATEGVLWEVGLMASSGHLAKTVFIVPPELADRSEVLRRVGEKLGVELNAPTDKGPRVVAFFRQAGGGNLVLTSARPTELDYELALRRFQITLAP